MIVALTKVISICSFLYELLKGIKGRRCGSFYGLFSRWRPSLTIATAIAMLSLFKNYPCENYFNDNIEKVLPVAAEGGDTAVRTWIDSNWLVFRMLYKSWLDKMFAKNTSHTEKYLREVGFLFSFLFDLIYLFQRFSSRIKSYVAGNKDAINIVRGMFDLPEATSRQDGLREGEQSRAREKALRICNIGKTLCITLQGWEGMMQPTGREQQ